MMSPFQGFSYVLIIGRSLPYPDDVALSGLFCVLIIGRCPILMMSPFQGFFVFWNLLLNLAFL
jgi:hypothetical protein